MNLYFRLMIAMIRGFFLQKMNINHEFKRSMRVLPNDIDINGHLNNGRYMTLIDLMVIESSMRVGILSTLIKLGWEPMTAGNIITYRKQLAPFERFCIQYKMDCWDEKWTYMKYRFTKMDGSLVAVGYLKCGFVSKKGLVPQDKVNEKLNFNRGTGQLSPAIALWSQSEQAMVSHW